MWSAHIVVLAMIMLLRLRDYWQQQQVPAFAMAVGIALLIAYEVIRKRQRTRTGHLSERSGAGSPEPKSLSAIGAVSVLLIVGGFVMEFVLQPASN